MIGPTAVRSTREQIADHLRNDVLSGRLAAGEKLIEENLAERFGVSRGPIREAISQLTSEGLFISKKNCGVAVAAPAPESLHQVILPIRRTLELYALDKIFDDLNENDFRFWDDLLFQMERACRQNDVYAFPQLDIALHRSFLERTKQPDLLAIWQTIVSRLRSHFWRTVQHAEEMGTMLMLWQHHVDLISAIRQGPKTQAIAALEAHIYDN